MTLLLLEVSNPTLCLSRRLTILQGGTAGMVLANRLSEVPEFRVLVIEAGPEPTAVVNYESPGGNQFLGGIAIDVSPLALATKNQSFVASLVRSSAVTHPRSGADG
jgi:hypothetical protein